MEAGELNERIREWAGDVSQLSRQVLEEDIDTNWRSYFSEYTAKRIEKIARESYYRSLRRNTEPRSVPKACLWFSWLLLASIRERVFEPAYQDALADYIAGEQSRGRFLVVTGWLVVLSWGAVIGDKITTGLAKFIPAPLRKWWSSVR